MPALVASVSRFADRQGLLPRGAHVLVAVSGGPDSSVLLDLLARARVEHDWRLTVAHFNHGLRGPDAAADEAAVRARADALGLACRVGRPDAPLRPDEATLREARYAWLGQIARACGAERVAVGHTRDDQVETVLLRLLRGTGLHGLGGMRPLRPLTPAGAVLLVRPLLATSRADVLAHAHAHGVAYRIDATNTDPARTRNRLRHAVLPRLRAVRPGVDRRIAALADRLAADDAYLEDRAATLAQRLEQDCGIGWRAYAFSGLAAAPPPIRARVLGGAYRAIAETPYGPDAEALAGLTGAWEGAPASGALDWPGSVRVRWTPERLVMVRVPTAASLVPVPLVVPGTTPWPATRQCVRARLRSGSAGLRPGGGFLAPWEHVPDGLTVRGWRPGDRWRPAGRARPEPVAETLRALGVPADRRPAAPVLATAAGVWWVVGGRAPAGTVPASSPRTVLEVRVDAGAGPDSL